MTVPHDWSHCRVLVTGATGLLGSSVIEALLARGTTVVTLVRDQDPGNRAFAEGLLAQTVVVHGALEDHELAVRTLNEHEIDTVFHLGAQTIVGTANRSARSTFESNVRGTWQLLDACRECAVLVQRVVIASSDKAYGAPARLPCDEKTPLLGRAPYDASKACAELVAQSYAASFDVPLAITRCANLFGGGDLHWNRLVPGTIRSVLAGERPSLRGDGRHVRDWLYVEDAAAACLTLAERLGGADGAALRGEAFNLGMEQPIEVLAMVRRIAAIAGRPDLEPIVLDGARDELRDQRLDCSKARRVLGFAPRFTLDQALRRTIDWYRARNERLDPRASG
ncbi:MAG: NAD-dependent epimerase/dehydratase family protein [Myxococcales bacterium]|nr:NAD-dependent epimerase/dehydratase family protein [Myxococcales bacterium]